MSAVAVNGKGCVQLQNVGKMNRKQWISMGFRGGFINFDNLEWEGCTGTCPLVLWSNYAKSSFWQVNILKNSINDINGSCSIAMHYRQLIDKQMFFFTKRGTQIWGWNCEHGEPRHLDAPQLFVAAVCWGHSLCHREIHGSEIAKQSTVTWWLTRR